MSETLALIKQQGSAWVSVAILDGKAVKYYHRNPTDELCAQFEAVPRELEMKGKSFFISVQEATPFYNTKTKSLDEGKNSIEIVESFREYIELG